MRESLLKAEAKYLIDEDGESSRDGESSGDKDSDSDSDSSDEDAYSIKPQLILVRLDVENVMKN